VGGIGRRGFDEKRFRFTYARRVSAYQLGFTGDVVIDAAF